MQFKWPCLLQECVSSSWRADDVCLRYWADVSSHTAEESLTFFEFDSFSTDLANLLRTHCSSARNPDQKWQPLIGIVWMPHILASVAVHAVVKASAAFYPVSFDDVTRLRYFEQQLNAIIYLCDPQMVPTSLSGFVRITYRGQSGLFNRNDWCLWVNTSSDTGITYSRVPMYANSRLAYIISTSGSCAGVRKMVYVAHSCITANIVDLHDRFNHSVNTNTRGCVLLTAPLTFDPSLVQIYFALSSHRCLIIPTSGCMLAQSDSALTSLCINADVDWLQCTPGMFLQQSLSAQRDLLVRSQLTIILGGEPFPLSAIASIILPHCAAVYGIYGVTEVSSWSMLYCLRHIDGWIGCNCNPPISGSTPIGFSMLASSAELINRTSDELIGELALRREKGGYVVHEQLTTRTSASEFYNAVNGLADSSSWLTGDMAVYGSCQKCLWFVGRRDRIVKRFGHQICIDRLEHVISRCHTKTVRVRFCKCQYFTLEHRLTAYVCVCEKNSCTIVARNFRQSLRSAIMTELNSTFAPIPYPWIPSQIIISRKKLRCSPHGKMCYSSCDNGRFTRDQYRLAWLTRSWNELVGNHLSENVPDTAQFLMSGGTSLSALLLTEMICSEFPVFVHRKNNLQQLVFTSSFRKIADYLCSNVRFKRLNNNHVSGPYSSLTIVRNSLNSDFTASKPELITRTKGEPCAIPVNSCKNFVLETLWKCNLDKCVDASPVIVHGNGSDLSSAVVVVGSHSGSLVSLRLIDGQRVWSAESTFLGGRVEASATIIPLSNSFIVVGTLDGLLHCVDFETGQILATHHTGGAIKSPATVIPDYNLFVCAGHGRRILAFDARQAYSKTPAWKSDFDNTPIVASLTTGNRGGHQLFAGSLGGTVGYLDLRQPRSTVWAYRESAPIFSKPLYKRADGNCSEHLFVSGADGSTCAFIPSTGELKWRAISDSPCSIFSDITMDPLTENLIFSTSIGQLKCIDSSTGHGVWNVNCSNEITGDNPRLLSTSTCLIGRGPNAPRVLAVNRADGAVIFCPINNQTVHSTNICNYYVGHHLSAHCFSSPVIHWPDFSETGYLVLGSRDNCVHCFRLSI